MIENKKSISFSFNNDKSPSSELEFNVVQDLRDMGVISTTGRKLVSFCGLLIQKNVINVFMPRGIALSTLPHNKKIELSSSLMRAIEKFGRESKTSIDSKDEGRGIINSGSLSRVKYLLDDFLKNGLYSQRKSIYNFNNGKPNWTKTVSRLHPYPTRSDQPVYLDTYCTKRQYFNQNIVASIHAAVIRQLDSHFSWLLTGKIGLVASDLKSIPIPQGNTLCQVSILKRELCIVYSKRDIKLLTSLIHYLENNTGNSESGYLSGITDFHFAWEHMLSRVLSNTLSLNSCLPAPAYVMKGGQVKNEAIRNMRLDISIKHPHKNRIVIIDAKYYGAISGELPGWSDLVKQFYYEKAVSLIYSDEYTFINAFIFPGNNGPYHYAIMKDRNSNNFYPETFPPIHCLYVCPSELINHYIRGQKMVALDRILLELKLPDINIY